MTSGYIQRKRSDGEIYWIVKHGTKLTGMPAFGPTHDEQELWGLVALAKEMPRMSPEHYRQLVKAGDSERKKESGHGRDEPWVHGEA
jgi:mono/diheme cytochrome c family protein